MNKLIFLKNKITGKKLVAAFLLVMVVSINLFFGFPRLERFSAIDEALWSYDRVPKFWKSLKKGNLRGTSLCDKPGVTLAAISGIGLPFVPYPKAYKDLRSKAKTPQQLEDINNIYFFLRLPIYLFTVLSLFGFYYLIRRLWNWKIAIFSVILIGLSPLLLGISLIVNTDAILWILVSFSLLCFLIHQKEGVSLAPKNFWNKNNKFLYLSGFILGLAILDKYVANLLFPFLLFLIFLKYILDDIKKEEEEKYFKKSLKEYLTLTLIALATIFVFYPNAWIEPDSILSVTIFSMAFEDVWPFFVGALATISIDIFWMKSFVSRKVCNFLKKYSDTIIKLIALAALLMIFFVILNVFQGMKYYDFEHIFFWPKADIAYFDEFLMNLLSAFYPLIFGIPPLTAFFFVFFIISLIIGRKNSEKKDVTIAFSLLSFVLIFYLANSSAQISSTVRYQIVVYPIVSILAAFGIWQFLNMKCCENFSSKFKFLFTAFLLIFLSNISLRLISPFFLSYSSELLPKKYIINPRDMADGSFEASEYLNYLPNAKDLTVWSDKKQVCEKFIGRCTRDIEDKGLVFDYYVTSRSAKEDFLHEARVKETGEYKIGNTLVNLPKLYDEKYRGDYNIVIGGRKKNFVKITSAPLVNINKQ